MTKLRGNFFEAKADTQKMSFNFPISFYNLISGVSMRYGRDMTYIIMEAVNEWVMRKEGIMLKIEEGDTRMNIKMEEMKR